MLKKEDRVKDFFTRAIKKMFSIIGLRFTKKAVAVPNWYLHNEWTIIQVKKYREWFIDNIRKDLKYSKKLAEKEFSWFYLMYGWKLKENERTQHKENY